MKYCPQCKRQYTEEWLAFCSDDGTPLIEDLTPAKDPNWDPKIREPKVDTASEQETQWLPREPPLPGGWIAPDERPPMSPGPWQPPPPPPFRPNDPTKQPSQALGLASMIAGIFGVVMGWCFGPVPGLLALILGWMALSQNKKSPDQVGGKSYAVAGMILGSLNLAFYLLFLIWFLVSLAFR